LRGQGYQPPAQKIELLILGGSLGAKIFGTLIPAALTLLPEDLRARLIVTQQCRADDLQDARNVLRDAGIDAELSPFFYDVAARLRRAQLVIARAGASTVAELGVAGRPAILIPLPNAIDDHQRANADALAEAGGAWRMDQATLTPELLAGKIASLLASPQTLQNAAAAAAGYGNVNAAEQLAALVQDMMAKVARA
jgi:UDP-N-acetylglucosamine--N-acetylmuramyl-(pentapeptide) pyrophosphoryl-undecaprenol N-acetylglucosamine transferase